MSDAPLVLTNFRFNPPDLEKIREAAGKGQVIFTPDRDEFDRMLARAEVVCAFQVPEDILERAPHLRWYQFPGAGVDNLQRTGLLSATSPVVVTSVAGIHAIPISEYVFASMLMFAHHFPEMVLAQQRHDWAIGRRWNALRGAELAGKTLGVIGLGGIGRRIAQLGRAFGMHVLGLRRSAGSSASDPDVDELYPSNRLRDLLGACDYVVLAVPLTAETERLIGEHELLAMRPNAYLVNISRGRVIDEQALIRALESGWIAGAGLDVTVEEPLPQDNPLWDMPNVILTPHMSGLTDQYSARLTEIFAENLHRYRAGQPLLHIVDPTLGY
ncbi:MAG TPA: D-2-hydroxyacid dehydrogenase [Ktedonobacterales bacterium]|nr:D-2-hydroxyacid dehydrogenase [Ktedonobacterales bacterium]